MLRPARTVEACRTTSWMARDEARDPLAVAVDRLFVDQPEADALANVRVRWRVRNFLVARRECVVVTADVVRRIRVIRLPSVGHHH